MPELLGNDFRGRVWVEEAMPNGLAHELLGPAIVALGASGLVHQSLRALLRVRGPELKVALATESEALCGSFRAGLPKRSRHRW